MATDGPQGGSAVEPGREDRWENVLTESIGDLGIDPSQPFATDGTDTSDPAPQSASDASSPDPVSTDSPETPQTQPTGDAGTVGTESVPASPTAASPESTDDLATATPFEYTVGDETKKIEGTYRIPGEGLIVPEEHVARFQQMASRSDVLDQQNRALYAELQSAKQRDETWQRLTAWQVQGQDGKTETLTGHRGLAEMRTVANRSNAVASAIGAIFDDPSQAGKLTMQVQGTDGQIYTIWNPDAVASLQSRAEVAAMRADRQVLGQLAQLQAPPPPAAPSASDIQSMAPTTVDQIIQATQSTGLTEQDKTFLISQLPRYVRPTRPDDQSSEPLIVDASFVDVVKDRAAVRAEAIKAAQQAATTAAQAQKFNNGMTPGAKPAAPRAAAPATPTPTPERRSKASDWQAVLDGAVPNLTNARTWDDVNAALNQ